MPDQIFTNIAIARRRAADRREADRLVELEQAELNRQRKSSASRAA